MKFAASLTVTGLLGYLLLEALKFVLAPVAAWLLAVTMVAVKFLATAAAVAAALAFGALAIGVGVYVYKRTRKDAVRA